jgi:hypothetical protein
MKNRHELVTNPAFEKYWLDVAISWWKDGHEITSWYVLISVEASLHPYDNKPL